MAFTDVPNNAANLGADYFQKTSDGSGNVTGLSATTDYVCIPLDKCTGLTTAEADEASGSWRKICRGIIDGLYSIYADKASADRATQMTLTRGSLVGTGDEVTRTYSASFDLDSTLLEVADE